MSYPTGEMPRCMGKKSQTTGEWYWQPQHPECAGGPDPAFLNQADGSNTRPKCPWFAQCAATTNANKLAATQANPISMNMPGRQIQPTPGPLAAVARGVVQGIAQVAQQQQARPAPLAAVPLPPPAPVQPWQQPQQQVAVRPPQWQQPQLPQQMQPWQQQQMQMQQYGQVPMVPPQMAMLPQLVPMNMPMPGAHVMGYLAVPEPIMEGQHWAARLGFSILRASFKATGHTMANFFDFNPFGSYPQNGG